MNLLWQGILLGLGLSILAGPMLFILIQTGIERGFKAGMLAGSGAWISDLLYIFAVYFGVSYVQQVTQWEGFELCLALIGGIVLIIVGAGALIHQPQFNEETTTLVTTRKTYLGLMLKCFLINTLNPFAAIFWLGVMSTVTIDGELNAGEAILFFSAIMGTIVLTDALKVGLAKKIKPFLNSKRMNRVRYFTGIALIGSGILLILRGIF